MSAGEGTGSAVAPDVVVDTSAAVALLLEESGAPTVRAAFLGADRRVMSTVSLVELSMVLEGRLDDVGIADRFVRDFDLELVPVDAVQASRAVEGWRRFGKGRHPAALNLGDCFTYALAITTGFPVLCVGTDFARTDVPVLPEPRV